MKQVFCFLLILALFIVPFGSIAEEASAFSYRNGVVFGDSKEAVIEKEGKPDIIDDSYISYKSRKLSGITKSELQYEFNSTGLYGIWISYSNYDHIKIERQEQIEEDYKVIEDGLTKKYGPAENIQDFSNVTTFKGCAIYSYLSETDRISAATQRIVNDGANLVYIEHIIYVAEKYNRNSYRHYLSYVLINPNEEFVDPVLRDL